VSDKYSEIEKAFKAYASGHSVPDEPEPGWFSVADYAKEKAIGERMAQRQISELYAKGLLEVKRFSLKRNFRTYPINHYRLCKRKTA